MVAAIEAVADPQLRDALSRAMISMLGESLLDVIREMMMDRLVIPESPGFKALRREFEALGEVRGEANALCAMLEARGWSVDDATRARITSCEDVAQIRQWIARAVKASSLDEVFGLQGEAE